MVENLGLLGKYYIQEAEIDWVYIGGHHKIQVASNRKPSILKPEVWDLFQVMRVRARNDRTVQTNPDPWEDLRN